MTWFSAFSILSVFSGQGLPGREVARLHDSLRRDHAPPIDDISPSSTRRHSPYRCDYIFGKPPPGTISDVMRSVFGTHQGKVIV